MAKNFILFLVLICLGMQSYAKGKDEFMESNHIPLVYDKENTADIYPRIKMKAFEELPSIPGLPDPFAWTDGSGRSTDFKDWERHRSEIMQMLYHYEIGEKPVVKKEQMKAEIVNDTLYVDITVGNETLRLTAAIKYPEGEGPFPAIIGIGFGTGSLPKEIFDKRGVAQITPIA